ncbi:MAG: ABC transporter substrate-binding protein [Actinomycetes bacterium]
MSRLRLSFACGDYDRTRPLLDGTVQADGIDLVPLCLPVEETFFRMLRHQEFEVAELSLSSYVVSLERGAPFVALPVYTSRSFRLGGAFISAASGITSPEQLAGRRVGSPEFQLTACVWIRGILADHYDLPVDAPTYVLGGQETAGRVEKARLDLPPSIRVEQAPAGRTLSGLLADGELDALYSPRIPSTFDGQRVRRLFPDVVAADIEYFRRSGIFPLMHVVVVRRDVYEANRWVAQSLTKALTEAKRLGDARLWDTSALPVSAPWLLAGLESAREVMGPDFWSYGLPGNEAGLDTFLRYHHEQGLSAQRHEVGELFAPESLESFVI